MPFSNEMMAFFWITAKAIAWESECDTHREKEKKRDGDWNERKYLLEKKEGDCLLCVATRP